MATGSGARALAALVMSLSASGVEVGAALAAGADGRPRTNIVFVLSDDHRWDALGAAGNKTVQTPALDRLAAGGVWLRQATIHVPQCSPSRATLLTGLPPHAHGWYSNQHQRADVRAPDGFRRMDTVPGLLRKAGYRTVLVGKWHLAPAPWNCGFSDVRVWMPPRAGSPDNLVGSGPYVDPTLAEGKGEARKFTGRTQDILAEDAIAFLDSDEAKKGPFFLWLAFTAPHGPYGPNSEEVRALYAGKPVAELLPPGFPADAAKAPWHDYYEAVSALDRQVGRVLEALERRRLAQRTAVVFLGDNGYMMGERGWNGKVIPYESSLRVPLIVRGPGIPPSAAPRDVPVSSLDLPPTFLALAGVKVPRAWPGRSLLPLLRGQQAPAFEDAVSEWADEANPKFPEIGPYRVLRTASSKLIVWQKAARGDELYDLARDPHERHNLVADREHAGLLAKLRSRLATWMARTADPARGWQKVAPAIPAKP